MLNKQYLLILALFLSVLTYGQSSSTEERRLNKIINDPASADTSIANAYLELSEVLYVENIDTLIPLCEKCAKFIQEALKKEISEESEYELLESLAGAYNNIGFAYEHFGNNKMAMENYLKAQKIQEKIEDIKGLAIIHNNLGLLLNRIGEVEESLNHYRKSLLYHEKTGDKKGLAHTYNNMGILYSDYGEFELAIEYHQKSLQLRESIDNQHGIAISYNNLGTVYQKMGDFETALTYYQRSMKIRKEQNHQKGIASSSRSIGTIYRQIDELETALDFHNEALRIREADGEMHGVAQSLVDLGEIYYQQGYIEAAEQRGVRAFEIGNDLGFPEIIQRAALLLSQVYKADQKGFLAFEMLEISYLMKDSLKNIENEKAVAIQQSRYEFEKQKELDKAKHEKDLLFEQEEKQKQEIITYAVGGGLILVAAFLIFVFQRLRITRRQKDEIDQQKNEIESQQNVLKATHSKLEEKNQEVLDSIRYAKRIQSAILPSDSLFKQFLPQAFVWYQPKDIVAGDFYWLEKHDDVVFIAAADCTGHGVPGALVSVVCHNALNRAVREFKHRVPGEILDRTRSIVIGEFEKSTEDVKDGMDIALCAINGNQLSYAGANNPLWVIKKDTKEVIEIKANKEPIGMYDKLSPYTSHTLKLDSGDSFYVFSDGYVDQFGGENGKKFKSKALKDLLLSIVHLPMEEQKKAVITTFNDWKGNQEQIDDICIIGVCIA